MPPKRKDSRRNRDAPALLPQITLRSGPCQIKQKAEGKRQKSKGKGKESKGTKAKVKRRAGGVVFEVPVSNFQFLVSGLVFCSSRHGGSLVAAQGVRE